MSSATTNLPSGTDTEEWRVMSARFAWLYWLADRRAVFPQDNDAEAQAWKAESTEYRAYIRLTLRNLTQEGLHLVRGNDSALADDEQHKTHIRNRIAWRAWLIKYRASYPMNPTLEQTLWKDYAPERRQVVDTCLKMLAKDDVHIVKKDV